MSTSTTRDGTSAPRTRPGSEGRASESRGPHLVHGRATGAEPDARADLDRAAARPADDLAPPLWPAVQARDAPAWRRLRDDVLHRVPRAGDRDHERLLRRDLERDGDGQRPRPRRDSALPRHAGQPRVAGRVADRALGSDLTDPGNRDPPG